MPGGLDSHAALCRSCGVIGTELLLLLLLSLAQLAVLLRALLRRHRDPATRLAWVLVVMVIPVFGMIAYLLLGELRIGARRLNLVQQIARRTPRPSVVEPAAQLLAGSEYSAPFALGRTVNDLPPTVGNSAELSSDENAAVDAMVADIDSARHHVHFLTYIWLDDNNGCKLKDALSRAARRGVDVRALADALGSRGFIRSNHWRELEEAGVAVREALPVGNLLWTMIRGRVDLRNHRKLLIVDNDTGWCGSQNAADPEFRIKAKYAPWVDIMTRWKGPVVRELQYLFVIDWLAESDQNLDYLLSERPLPDTDGTIIAQVIGTGPALSIPLMSAVFCELIYSARRTLTITTPYFVPDENLLFALVSAARRGVETTLVVPQRNDSRIVAAASRSHYRDLVEAGVTICEFRPGLLHAKTMVVDESVALIGSANLDRRSFELNFEANVLFMDSEFVRQLGVRQQSYIAQSAVVGPDEIADTGHLRHAWYNFMAMIGPLL